MLVTAARNRKPANRKHKLESYPAPVGGWNARDSYAAMPPTDAITLVNWLPDVGGIRCRKGYSEWATDMVDPIGTVMGYFPPTEAFSAAEFIPTPSEVPGELFACTDGDIFDVTASTDAATSVVTLSGNANAGWFSHTQMSNSGGSWLLACSEADGYYTYDGTTWTKRVAGASAGQINGVDPATLCFVTLFKRRPWFIQKNTTKAWYLPVDSISGTIAAFDFGPLFKHGGHLAYLANWTIDAGEGIDDFLVVVSSSGDVLVYKGTDPASASTFALQGSWYVGQIPVGRRAFTQYGGDLLILSTEGLFPLSYVTRGGAGTLQATNKEYTSKIRGEIGKDLQYSFALQGWQMLLHPSERILLVNVPDYSASVSRQYAMSTVFNEWGLHEGVPIFCLGSHAGYSFAGTQDGRVLLIFSGQLDNVLYGTSTGSGVSGRIIPAFSTFGAPSLEKHMLMVRCNFLAADTPGIEVNVNVNYNLAQPTATPTYGDSGNAQWDTAVWDTSKWAGAQRPYSVWASVNGIGFAAAATLNTLTLAGSVMTSIDYMYEVGGPL